MLCWFVCSCHSPSHGRAWRINSKKSVRTYYLRYTKMCGEIYCKIFVVHCHVLHTLNLMIDSTIQLARARCGWLGTVEAWCSSPPMSAAFQSQTLPVIASHQRPCSARHCLPCHRCITLGCWAFSVAGPTVWNLLPDQFRDSDCIESTFRQSLKTFFFSQY